MTQSQFMYELMKELDGVNDESKYVIMNDYTGFFSEQTDNGRSVDEIIAMLHTPKEIAESYKNGKPFEPTCIASDTQEKNPAYKRVLKFILLIPCAIVLESLSALAGTLLVLLSVILCIASVAVSVYSFSALSLSFGFIIIGIGGILFTFSFIMLCVASVQLTVKMLTAFPKYMSRVLNNTDGSVK